MIAGPKYTWGGFLRIRIVVAWDMWVGCKGSVVEVKRCQTLCWGRKFGTGRGLLQILRIQGQDMREECVWMNHKYRRGDVLMVNLRC